jgi:hypothetical protein
VGTISQRPMSDHPRDRVRLDCDLGRRMDGASPGCSVGCPSTAVIDPRLKDRLCPVETVRVLPSGRDTRPGLRHDWQTAPGDGGVRPPARHDDVETRR